MRPTLRYALVALILVGSAGIAFWATRLHSRPPTTAPGSEQATVQSNAEVVVNNPELVATQAGRPAWKVILDKVQLSSGGNTVAAQGLREGLVYDDAGKPIVRITARQVTADINRKDFEVTGQVTVTSPRGVVITTEKAQWLNAQQMVRCPGTVVTRAKNLVITTRGLDYSVQADTLMCPNQVRMYSGNNRLVGRSLKYDNKTGIADVVGVQIVVNPQEAKQILKELPKQ